MAAPKKGSRRSVESTLPSDTFMEKLKTFVRTRGMDFLRDPNITSVGIGYKRKGRQADPGALHPVHRGPKSYPRSA